MRVEVDRNRFDNVLDICSNMIDQTKLVSTPDHPLMIDWQASSSVSHMLFLDLEDQFFETWTPAEETRSLGVQLDHLSDVVSTPQSDQIRFEYIEDDHLINVSTDDSFDYDMRLIDTQGIPDSSHPGLDEKVEQGEIEDSLKVTVEVDDFRNVIKACELPVTGGAPEIELEVTERGLLGSSTGDNDSVQMKMTDIDRPTPEFSTRMDTGLLDDFARGFGRNDELEISLYKQGDRNWPIVLSGNPDVSSTIRAMIAPKVSQ